jgi:predicted NAD/FAD-binding protein
VSVTTAAGTEDFDEVVLAVHSDQALAMLADPTDKEREILGAMPYVANEVTLHTDRAALPARRPVWSSWNYTVPRDPLRRVAVTYDMNILQGFEAPEEFCVTLNRPDLVDSARVLSTAVLHHPVYLPEGVNARGRLAEISGVNRTHYCGAYWGYGFHEDGVRSALAVGSHFGEEL